MVKKDIQERTLNFSIRVVKLCKFLRENGGTGYDLSKQLYHFQIMSLQLDPLLTVIRGISIVAIFSEFGIN